MDDSSVDIKIGNRTGLNNTARSELERKLRCVSLILQYGLSPDSARTYAQEAIVYSRKLGLVGEVHARIKAIEANYDVSLLK
jgi:hypothetical protein